MEREYNNKQVYDFLIEECKLYPNLWKEYGTGLVSHSTNAEFWENLSEEIDCFRICDECGKPMIEGYVVDGRNTYCSEDCLHKHITEEEFISLFDNGDGDTYYTNWYENSISFNNTIK